VTGERNLADLPLFAEPTAFELFQAVRLLARAQPDRDRVGYFGDPSREIARFGANPDASFPASELQAIAAVDDGPPRLTVNVMGLNGPLGTLPLVYSHLVSARLRQGDPTLGAFLDLFNHRMISLFYRAWEKHRVAVGYETQTGNRLGDHLADLVGLGTSRRPGRLAVSTDAVLSFAGLFAPAQRSAVALEELLSEYFSVPAAVEQFVGGWHALDRASCTEIGADDGPATQLGVGAVAGDEIWDPQSRVRVRLGPLSRAQYDRFLPGGEAHEALRALVRFFADDQVEVEAQLVLAADEVPGCVLDADAEPGTRLAWGTWLRTRAMTRDPDETVLSL
jgi:type VI secretion system protein ImpH